MPILPFVAALLISLILGAGARAHEASRQAKPGQASPSAAEPLYDNLGTLRWPIRTDSTLAQDYFDQGIRWTYAFNHAAARRAFQAAQRLDPNCAICFWGEGFVLGGNINAGMAADAVDPALRAIERAQALGHHASPAEQALIDALAHRYTDGAPAYADAMAGVRDRFPDDPNIAVLFADAVMNITPWDYWLSDGATPRGRIGGAIAAVEGVLAKHPDHPGAIHLYIHLVEASTTPERAEPHADRLVRLMPGAGHMVHMASHIYYRIGRFGDSMATNKSAVAADEAYLAEVPDQGLWRFGYYPHNIHFTLVSGLMAGDRATALAYVDRLEGKVSGDLAAGTGWLQAIAQAPYFAHAHLSDPATILGLADPGDRFAYVKAAWHYARGVAFGRTGAVDRAQAEAAAIADLIRRTDGADAFPSDIAPVAPDVLKIARHVVLGRIAQATGAFERAVEQFAAATDIQDNLAYLEPPFWYYPVRQSLGAALLQAGKANAAERVFAESLQRVPNNGWALYGLMRAHQAQGKTAAAAQSKQRLGRAWVGDLTLLSLAGL